MSLQQQILIGFAILSLGIVAIFTWVALSTRAPALSPSVVTEQGNQVRRLWVGALLVALGVSFVITFPRYPYANDEGQAASVHYSVEALQYAFLMPTELPVNMPVTFDVTASDVNHGFGIYDPGDRLIAQVQAMPNYVNHLNVTFRQPGTYTVRCLEYCGIVHHYMQSSFEVK
jgi:cytochrome c oxidase subunit II